MASIISASTTSGTALNLTADTSGVLEIKTGAAPTTALTLDASQNATFANVINGNGSGITSINAANVSSGVLSQAQGGTGTTTGYYGFKNRIINGAMVIDQRNAGASVTPTASSYTLDRFAVIVTQSSKFSVQQNAGSVTPPNGFSKYAGITSLSAYSVLTGDTFTLYQAIEGFNTADLGWGTANAKTVTLSFQVYSSLTGTFGGSIRNSAADRSYPFSYSIPVANTWTTISVTIAGDTTGTWIGATNGIGMYVGFGLGSGATFSGTAGAWAAGNLVQPTGTVSVVGTSGATFYITGVQLEVGSTATSFDYLDYGRSLIQCQRYYYRLKATAANYPFGFAQCYSTTSAGALIPYPVTMRTAPSALEQSGTAGDYAVYSSVGSQQVCTAVPAYAGVLTTTAYGAVNFTVASGIVAGNVTQGYGVNSSAYLGWSAEL